MAGEVGRLDGSSLDRLKKRPATITDNDLTEGREDSGG